MQKAARSVVWIVRHGDIQKPEGPPVYTEPGKNKFGLTTEGQQQVAEAGQSIAPNLPSSKPVIIFTSKRERCVQSATILRDILITAGYAVAIQTNEDLNDHRLSSEWYGTAMNIVTRDRWAAPRDYDEPRAHFTQRANKAIKKAFNTTKDGSVIVIGQSTIFEGWKANGHLFPASVPSGGIVACEKRLGDRTIHGVIWEKNVPENQPTAFRFRPRRPLARTTTSSKRIAFRAQI